MSSAIRLPQRHRAAWVALVGLVTTTVAGAVIAHGVDHAAVADAVRRLARDADRVHLVCAGTDGAISAEDVLAAGAILDAATGAGTDDVLDDSAFEARGFFRRVAARGDLPAVLVDEFGRSPGGVNLIALGMQADLPAAAAIDSLPLAPRLDRTTGSLTA
jgi:2-phosphosulfolactate phosphatase